MALSPLRAGRERRTAAAFLVAGVFALSAVVAHAEDGNSVGVAGASSPVEQFSRQLEDFQKSVPDLNKSIQESTGAIDSVTDIDKARADIDKLRAGFHVARRRVGQWPSVAARNQGARSYPRQA
jgi:peptidoglycan hydrolase CwlO-like protein